MQTAIKWRPTVDAEFTPVCSDCWSELTVANMLYAHAVATPGVTLSLRESE